jgi:prophage regulatory protein
VSDRFLNRKERRAKDGLSDPTVWRLERKGLYPPRRKLSEGRVGWLESEVNAWIVERKKVKARVEFHPGSLRRPNEP